MKRLADAHHGKDAVVLLGGPSVLERGLALDRIDRDRAIVFLESKALTPRFLSFGLEPHYYLMNYPEKCKTNSLQHVVFQSLLAGIDLRPLLRPEWHKEIDHLEKHFDRYLEPWQADNPRKRFRWRRGVHLPGSPFDLLPRLPHARLIAFDEPFAAYVEPGTLPQPVFLYGMRPERGPFDPAAYYAPYLEGERLVVRDYGSTNLAAIALFPLLRWMGFRRVFLVGMDMSMVGTAEHAAPFTFRSMRHFRQYYDRARPFFSSSFPSRRQELMDAVQEQVRRSGPWARANPWTYWRAWQHGRRFLRPPAEFQRMDEVLRHGGLEFLQVYEPYRYSAPLDGVRRIGYEEFLQVVGR